MIKWAAQLCGYLNQHLNANRRMIRFLWSASGLFKQYLVVYVYILYKYFYSYLYNSSEANE
jgi:phage shock protein PspC (stress-responsive transcriptional regulator)